MKGKRLFSLILFTTIMVLIACSCKTDSPKLLNKAGIAPYQLSESEKYILQSFGMENNSKIISFYAPEEAITVIVNVYRLDSDNNWDKIGGGGISIGADKGFAEQLTGTFTIQLRENYAIDYNINAGGRASYKTDEIMLDIEVGLSIKCFLQEFQEIEINKEIPVALMIYGSGTVMRICSPQDFFDPSAFDGMALVQAVTLTFSDKEL